MKSKLFLATFFVVVVASILGYVAATPSNDSSTPSVATASTVVVAQPPTPTPSAGPAPSVVWREVQHAETLIADFGTTFLLDTETGKIYSPMEGTSEDGTRAHMEWAPDGSMSVWIHKPGTSPEPLNLFFVGEALGEMKFVPGVDGQRVSSRGIAATRHDGAFHLFDVAKQERLGVLPLAPGQYPGTWSWDGRYLSIHHDEASRKGKNPAVHILDIETQRVVQEVSAHQVSWANTHNRFLYTAIDLSRGDNALVETRVSDLATGEDYAIGPMAIGFWSPDDRYLVGDAKVGERVNAFSVFDARDGKRLMTAVGSWAIAWVDNETIGFMADVCTATYSLYYVGADGSGLRRVFDDLEYGAVHPAPGGDIVAYTDYGDSPGQPNVVRVVTVSSSATQEFDVGQTYLLPHTWPSVQSWSADGKYLLLRAPIGKGGNCMGDEVVPFELIRHP